MNFVYLFVYRNVMKACDDLGRNAVHLAAGHTGATAQKLVDLLLNNCMDDELGLFNALLIHSLATKQISWYINL